MQNIVDVPVVERREAVGQGVQFHAFSQELSDGRFTNVYDISYRKDEARPAIHVHNQLTSVYNFAKSHSSNVVTGGGFFFLADIASGLPRQLALNLAAVDGKVRNLPVIDREAVVLNGRNLSAELISSLGVLSINGRELSWSGSLTSYETEAKVFGNGNAVITHEYDEATGSVRVLDERSRFTPAIKSEGMVDIGFIAWGDGTFLGKETSLTGGVDIFAHDVVVRCSQKYLTEDLEMKVHTIGSIAVDGPVKAALSVGPMLKTPDFESHPINKDSALGGKPPFLERPLARTALYESEDGTVHVRLFDGRPGSIICPGVTPSEVSEFIQAEGDTAWGCFLDPGQTAKLCVRLNSSVESLGNRHYLKWVAKPGKKYVWVPKIGRPTASVITLQ